MFSRESELMTGHLKGSDNPLFPERERSCSEVSRLSVISLTARSLVLGCWALTLTSGHAADDDRGTHLAQTKKIAEKFQVQSLRNEKKVVGKLGEKPLLKYNDSTRQLKESTLWLWTEQDVPCGLMAIEYYPDLPKGAPWLYEFVSLSDSKVTVTRGSDWNWNAKQAGLQRRPIPKAPAPATRPAQRLTQAKQLFLRFSAHESSPVDGRIELRPFANPLHRYSDEAAGLIDGTIFAFVNGTNPEVLLVLEAVRGGQDQPAQWRYSLAQMTGGEVAADLDAQEVWNQTEADPPAVRDSYVNGWLPKEDPQ